MTGTLPISNASEGSLRLWRLQYSVMTHVLRSGHGALLLDENRIVRPRMIWHEESSMSKTQLARLKLTLECLPSREALSRIRAWTGLARLRTRQLLWDICGYL